MTLLLLVWRTNGTSVQRSWPSRKVLRLGQDWSFRKGDGTTQRFLYNSEFLPSKIIRWSPPWPLWTRVQKLYRGVTRVFGRRLENSQLSSLVGEVYIQMGRTRNEITQVPFLAMNEYRASLLTTHHVSNKQLFLRLLPQFTSTFPRWSLPALSSRTMSLQQLGSKIWHGQSSLVTLEATAGMNEWRNHHKLLSSNSQTRKERWKNLTVPLHIHHHPNPVTAFLCWACLLHSL